MKTLVFDTETTGLIKNKLQPLDRQPQVIEFFGLSLEDGEEKAALSQLFNPNKPLEEIITKITGITDKNLSTAPNFSEHAAKIKEFIESHDEIVAHNLSFDRSIVDFEMARCKLKIEWPKLICTVEATHYMLGHRLNLSKLHELLFGEAFEGAHRAEIDVRALARCFNELRKMEIV